MINLRANDALKKLGCKWSGSEWVAPDIVQTEADAIKRKWYDDLVVIDVDAIDDKGLSCRDWGTLNVRMIAGYLIASVTGRDSGAKIADGVAILSGNFTSAGSRKNYYCEQSLDLKLRLKVSRNVLAKLDQEVEEGRYTYKILNTAIGKSVWEKRKAILLAQLAEAEEALSI